MSTATAIAVLACLAFVALAVLGWDLPIAKAWQYLWICLLMVLVLIGAAALVVALFKWLRR